MNQYVVKATGQVLAVMVFCVMVSFATIQILEYFQPTASQIMFVAAMALLAYLLYTLIMIQADILRNRDNLNK